MVEVFHEDTPHKFRTRTSLSVPFQLFDELVDSEMKSLDQLLSNEINEVFLSSIKEGMLKWHAEYFC